MAEGVMIWNQPGWDFKDVAKIFVRSGKGGGVEQYFRTKPFSHISTTLF